ncbi:MAG: Cof-type HAD-IIB family hydrolase [Tractidigestivibacter sp.]|jgi:Cof subfamily protein (haloacid dehalogenase superfamily)|uniref:Cof-type HAD-IIB family hydrolase n=1 Tax=Tractidigestivibacter sp. TaxID=2847320 RepID=UPI003D8A527C
MGSKIVFLDVDGTITDYENKIPDSAKRAIREARKNGNRVYMCTGRSKAENPPELWAIGFDGMIGGNGSYVEDNGEVVMHQLITAEQCRHIVDWLHERGLEFYLESNNGLFASENFREAARPVLRLYAGRKGVANADQLETDDVMHGMVYGANLYRDDVNKVSFILKSYQDHLDSIKEFPDLKCGTWGGAGETALFGDLGVKDITKAHAVDVLLKHLGADRADTIAFGDAKVDIPMFEACAVGVCMGSGGDEAKAAADYVTDAVDDDGLWNAFVHFGLVK